MIIDKKPTKNLPFIFVVMFELYFSLNPFPATATTKKVNLTSLFYVLGLERGEGQTRPAEIRRQIKRFFGELVVTNDGGEYRVTLNKLEGSRGLSSILDGVTLRATDVVLQTPDERAQTFQETSSPTSIPYGSYVSFSAITPHAVDIIVKRNRYHIELALRANADYNSLRSQPLMSTLEIKNSKGAMVCSVALEGTTNWRYL